MTCRSTAEVSEKHKQKDWLMSMLFQFISVPCSFKLLNKLVM